MVVIWIIVTQIVIFLFFYPLLLIGKQADEEMLLLMDENIEKRNRKIMEEREMESQREVLRMIETEIKKGSAPVEFMGIDFPEDAYHMVESQSKMHQLLDYFFRTGEYAIMADKQIRSNMYMDTIGRKPAFRSTQSELDRRNLEAAAKRWIKKKKPSFDGDVYVEKVDCCLDLQEERGKCIYKGTETTALIFSKKHLNGLYLQCLMHRKEIMERQEYSGERSEVGERIFRLEDVDVLFQCLLMDQMRWVDGKLCMPFCTVYLLDY